jgi:hypothetical protein
VSTAGENGDPCGRNDDAGRRRAALRFGVLIPAYGYDVERRIGLCRGIGGRDRDDDAKRGSPRRPVIHAPF